MGDERFPNPAPIFLERPFLSTVHTRINVNKGTIIMEFDREVVHFNIFDSMKYAYETNSIFAVSMKDPLV